jgi:hypothetical protein
LDTTAVRAAVMAAAKAAARAQARGQARGQASRRTWSSRDWSSSLFSLQTTSEHMGQQMPTLPPA